MRARRARDPGAVARFWAQLDSVGAPLVEFVPGDTTMRRVTFVWRADETVEAVAVITPYSLIDVELSRMRHMPGTDIWYRSYVMPADAVMAYRFGPDDALVPFGRGPSVRERMAAWRADPLNPSTFPNADGSIASVLRLKAPSAKLVAAPPRGRGTITTDTVRGAEPWPDLPITVYTPAGADRGGYDRPLVIIMDGDAYLQVMGIDSILDRLDVAPERLPVVVLVPPDRRGRTSQYDCNPAWSDVLAERLVPWIEQRYGTSQLPGDRIVGGYSLGGLAAACAAVRHPEVFGNVLAQSGSLYRAPDAEEPEAVARTLAARPRLPIRWSLSIGRLETAPIPNRDPSMLTATRHLRDVLTARGYSLQYHEFYGGHEQVAWAMALPDAMAFVLQR